MTSEEIPNEKGEQQRQAVGGNAEGKVPTAAPACTPESREGIRPPGSGAPCACGDGYAACDMVLGYECIQCGRKEWQMDKINKLERQLARASLLIARAVEYGMNGSTIYSAHEATEIGDQMREFAESSMREFLAGRAAGAGVGRCASATEKEANDKITHGCPP